MLSNDIESNDALRHLQRMDTSPSGLSRRRFLQAIAAGIGVGAAASLLPTGVADALTAIGAHDGVLLLVNLAGGLDGLNTVVPFGQSEYYDLRPSVNIAEAEVLPLASGIGLHPSLPFFKSQFDAGSLAIVQGVGAIDPDYSHFSMGARWMSGWAGTPANPTSGWVGRWLDGLATPDLLQAVEIGWGGVGLHMIGDNRAAVSVNPSDAGYGSDTNNWIQDSYRAVREMSAAAIPGTWSKAFADALRDQLTVAAAAAPAYVGVPNTSLGKFAIAAGLINANVGLRVVSVTIGGFDNHSSQPADLAALLTQLNDGLQLFWSTLSPLFQNRTTVMTFSEFGRRALANSSNGTDHGAAGQLFLMGPRVRGGLHSEYPSLTTFLPGTHLKATVDFRSVYQQVLDKWLGGDSRQLLGATYSGLNLFSAAPGDVPPPPTPPPVVVQTGAAFRAIVPERVLDTRNGLGAPAGKIGAAATLDLQLAGVGSIPPSGVVAALVNVTATGPTAAGYLTVWPTGSTIPNASNLNFVAGDTVPNLVLAKLGAGGKVSIFNAAGATHVLADVAGYFVEGDGSRLIPLQPSRVLDTRSMAPGLVGPATTIDLTLASVGGLPASGIDAVALNVTAVAPSAAGFVTVWPTGATMPTTSNLNFTPGKTVPNMVVTKVGVGSAISLFNAAGATHLLVDVVGYYASAGGTGTTAVTPQRLLDTRGGNALGAGAIRELRVVGVGPVPATGVSSVTLNVTAVGPTHAGFVTVFPAGSTPPEASNLNFVARQTVANLVVAKVASNGAVSFYNQSGTVDLLADVVGWS